MFLKSILNSLKGFLLTFLKNPQIYQFMVVGILNAVLLLLLTIFFTDFLNIFYLFSSIISYEITIILGFIIHEFWTFSKNKKTKTPFMRFFKYQIFYFLGLLINSIILFFLTDYFNINYTVSQFIGIFIVFFFNFYTSKKITFKN